MVIFLGLRRLPLERYPISFPYALRLPLRTMGPLGRKLRPCGDVSEQEQALRTAPDTNLLQTQHLWQQP